MYTAIVAHHVSLRNQVFLQAVVPSVRLVPVVVAELMQLNENVLGLEHVHRRMLTENLLEVFLIHSANKHPFTMRSVYD
jgi:hypothetical protein